MSLCHFSRSFILSTMGFTCVAFVAGALAWWGPKLLHLGMAASGNGGDQDRLVSLGKQHLPFRYYSIPNG